MTTEIVIPLYCQNCKRVSPAGACEVWLRMQGEVVITPAAIQVCKACGWRDCLPVMVKREPKPEVKDDPISTA